MTMDKKRRGKGKNGKDFKGKELQERKGRKNAGTETIRAIKNYGMTKKSGKRVEYVGICQKKLVYRFSCPLKKAKISVTTKPQS